MHTVILALQYPKGLKGLPVATTSNIAALRFFKRVVLQDWKRKIEETVTSVKLCFIASNTTDSRVRLTYSFPEGAASDEDVRGRA